MLLELRFVCRLGPLPPPPKHRSPPARSSACFVIPMPKAVHIQSASMLAVPPTNVKGKCTHQQQPTNTLFAVQTLIDIAEHKNPSVFGIRHERITRLCACERCTLPTDRRRVCVCWVLTSHFRTWHRPQTDERIAYRRYISSKNHFWVNALVASPNAYAEHYASVTFSGWHLEHLRVCLCIAAASAASFHRRRRLSFSHCFQSEFYRLYTTQREDSKSTRKKKSKINEMK